MTGLERYCIGSMVISWCIITVPFVWMTNDARNLILSELVNILACITPSKFSCLGYWAQGVGLGGSLLPDV